MLRTPLRAVWDIVGYPTETIFWPAQKQNVKKTILFFIPGNPGLVEYYTPFLESIYKNTSSLEIVGVSHKGHSAGYHEDIKQNTIYSLKDQIQHKVDCFDKLVNDNEKDTEFIIISHSIGSYISMELLRQRPNHGIKRVIALFPTIREIAATPNGIQISRLVKYIPAGAFGVAGSLISYMAPPFRQALVGLITGQSGQGLQVTAHQLLHGSVLKNVITMAHQEMETVKQLDHDFYENHLEKLIVYYSSNDKWAPKEHYDYMKKHFPELVGLHLCTKDIPHAFCLESEHVDYMANKVKLWIDSATA